MDNLQFRLSPSTGDGPYQSEEALLEALRHLAVRGTLWSTTVHVFHVGQVERTELGTIGARTVLATGEVDLELVR